MRRFYIYFQMHISSNQYLNNIPAGPASGASLPWATKHITITSF